MPKIIASEPKKKTGKWVAIWLIIIVVLAGAGFGGWYWWQQHNAQKTDSSQKTSEVSTTTGKIDTSKVAQVQQQANAAATNTSGGSVGSGVAVYDKAIQSTSSSDPGTLASLYYGKAVLLYNNQQSDQALPAAQKAVELDPSAANYGLLGTIYAKLGQKDNAIAAFKSALTAISKVQSDGGAGKGAMTLYYQQQIQQLGGSV